MTAWAVGQGALLGRARPVDEPGRAGPRADAGDKLAARQPGALLDDGRVHWVHMMSDAGTETWANLDSGRQFLKDSKTISMLETAPHELYTFEGRGPIIKSRARTYVDMKDRDGRPVPPAVFDLMGNYDFKFPRLATEQERKTSFFVDHDIETVGGRRLGRTDQYGRDALGESRLEKQIWLDLGTRRVLQNARAPASRPAA